MAEIIRETKKPKCVLIFHESITHAFAFDNRIWPTFDTQGKRCEPDLRSLSYKLYTRISTSPTPCFRLAPSSVCPGRRVSVNLPGSPHQDRPRHDERESGNGVTSGHDRFLPGTTARGAGLHTGAIQPRFGSRSAGAIQPRFGSR